jgi:DNA-directed RNA polymerase I, II, and III subunit RPABC2
MSDVDYSDASSSSDSENETNKSKNRTPVAKKTTKLAKPVSSDDENESSTNASDDSDDDVSVVDSKEDSDAEDDINPEEMNEDAFFEGVTKPFSQNPTDDEFQFGFNSSGDEEDSNLDDDDEDGQYLQKLDESVKDQIIANHHPELIIHNYDEVDALTTVVRDARGVVIDPLHRTLPFLSKYEKTRILGERAKQINDGAKPFVETNPSVIDGYLIALAELEQRKLPFIIRRPLSNGASEYWKLSDLEFI